MNPKRKHAYYWGKMAEILAMIWLLAKGYTVVAWRHRNVAAEVDIIACRGDILAFIEVKARANQEAALQSVTPDKQQRLQRAAESFIASHPKYARHCLRFDLMMLTSWRNITHLKDVWRG